MKTLPSTILKEGKPVSKVKALALAFIDQNKTQITKFLDKNKRDWDENQKNLAYQKSRDPLKECLLYGIFGVFYLIVAIVLLFFTLPFSKYIASGLMILVAIGIFGFAHLQMEAIKKEIAKTIEELELEAEEIKNRKPNQILTHLGTVNYSVSFQPFENKQILMDESGIVSNTDFTFPDIPVVGKFGEIKETLDNIPETLPTVLTETKKNHFTKDNNFELVGMENDLKTSLDTMSSILDQKREIKASIPLFDNQSEVIQSMNRFVDFFQNENDSKLTFNSGFDREKSLQALTDINDNAKEAQSKGSESDEAFLTKSLEFISSTLIKMDTNRTHSIQNVLGTGIEKLQPILDFPLTTFYCPECLKIPEYMHKKYTVHPKNAMDISDDQLKNYPKYEQIIELKKNAKIRKQYLEHLQTNGLSDTDTYSIVAEELESIKNQIIKLASTIIDHDPKAEQTRHNAVLKYNIVNKHWKCELCDTTFSEEDAKFGRILKVKDQLLIPVLDNLWLEKHDETNRVWREKETEIRTNKNEESSQIRLETDVFTKEYREVRNFLDTAGTQFDSNKDEFDRITDFLVAMNIVTQDRINELENKLFESGKNTTRVSSIIQRADNQEAELEKEPNTVFLRASELEDYTLELRNQEKFFKPKKENQALIAQDVKPKLEDKNG